MGSPGLRIAYLGPTHSFTHETLTLLYPEAEPVPAPSIREAVRLAEEGEVDKAFIPLENSFNGPVHETLDALAETMLHISLCVERRIRLVAAGNPKADKVYGHPHALAAASKWIEEHMPDATPVPAPSTSLAAQLAARENQACICSRKAAEANNLEILGEDVGPKDNYTRFILLEWRDNPREADRTALVAILPDKPGALYRFLEPLARHNVNLTMIYSRPARTTPWRYLFYLEMEGSRTNPAIADALKEARTRSLMLKILGSYPLKQLKH